jgi:small subunit ribosomal protein SAe
MSNPLAMTEADLKLLLAAQAHKGTKNCTAAMRKYIWRRAPDGTHIINLGKTWEKLTLAARVIVAIENPEDVVAVSARPYGARAVFKFAQHTGTSYIGGRYTPGTLTNQTEKRFQEARILVATDPRVDHQPIRESAYVNVPVIALCGSDAPLQHVDIAIPCNNHSKQSVALIYWLLAREVNRLRGAIHRQAQWNVMPDLFLYRDAEEIAAQAEIEQESSADAASSYVQPLADAGKGGEWGAAPEAEPAYQPEAFNEAAPASWSAGDPSQAPNYAQQY